MLVYSRQHTFHKFRQHTLFYIDFLTFVTAFFSYLIPPPPPVYLMVRP